MARPRRFDEQALLDSAQESFWVKGYDGASIDEIATASGVAGSSIYAAYGSKLGLFLAVFIRYCDGRVALVEKVVGAHSGSFEDAVGNYLTAIVGDCTSHADRRGCLMLNSIAELGARFPDVVVVADRSIARMEAVVSARVAESVDSGEIELAREQIEPLGAHIVLVSQGLIQLSRVGVPVERLNGIADTSRRLSALLAA